MITIELESTEARRLLNRLAARIKDLRRPMSAVGEVLIAQIDDAFESGRSPAGGRWRESARVKREGGLNQFFFNLRDYFKIIIALFVFIF